MLQPTRAWSCPRPLRRACRYAIPDKPTSRIQPGDTMTRQLISSGSQFEQDIGYSRAVVDGEWIFVSGTTGFNYQTMTISDNLLEQTDQCLKNIQSALKQVGSDLTDVVRVMYILPDGTRFPDCWPILR